MLPQSPSSPVERLRAVVAGLELGPGSIAALAVLASCACAGLVVLWWTARPVPDPTVAPAVAGAGTTVAPAAPAPASGPEPVASSGPVVVHVSGAVASAGVIELAAGSRVIDAVEAAGGARRRARTDGLNLARVVQDGEQIHVPTRGEAAAAVVAGSGSAAGTTAAAPRAAVPGTPAAPLSLNTATAAELEALPNVGPVLAGRIVAHRDSIGGFTAVEQLLEVDGIGEKTFAALRELVTV